MAHTKINYSQTPSQEPGIFQKSSLVKSIVIERVYITEDFSLTSSKNCPIVNVLRSIRLQELHFVSNVTVMAFESDATVCLKYRSHLTAELSPSLIA